LNGNVYFGDTVKVFAPERDWDREARTLALKIAVDLVMNGDLPLGTLTSEASKIEDWLIREDTWRVGQ
jgi:hypothetical protein